MGWSLYQEYLSEYPDGPDQWYSDYTRKRLLERDVLGQSLGLSDETWLAALQELPPDERFIVEVGSGIWWGSALGPPYPWRGLSRVSIAGQRFSQRALRERYALAVDKLRKRLEACRIAGR